MRSYDREKGRTGLKMFLFLVVLMAGGFVVLWFWENVGSILHGQKDTDVHSLPIAAHAFIDPPEWIAVDDRSVYAENEALTLYQYTCCYYDEDKLLAEADYDKEGRLINLNCWEYDTAGNICWEQTQNKGNVIQTRQHIFEYDSLGRNVHEKVFWDEQVVEDNYFRYTDQGRAGVSYSYLDNHINGGISKYCSYRIEYLEDEAGNLLCAFKLNFLNEEALDKVWKMQWMQQDDHMVNRVQFYEENEWTSNHSDRYRTVDMADREQVNLYEYNSETGEKNHILQLSYEWKSNKTAYSLSVPIYRARYEGNLLLWQMSYSDSGLVYYSACQYDADGRLNAVVEYEVDQYRPHAVFYRYEYPEKDKIEKYSYFVQGREFNHLFGNGESVLLTFSSMGILNGIEMRDASGELSEKYEFEAGTELGKFKRMYVGTKVIIGEKAILKIFEEEAELYGFQVGVDLIGHGEGGGE